MINVDTATIAAFVGAGGLGELIIAGISLTDHKMILQGVISAALLALVLDQLLMVFEKQLAPEGIKTTVKLK